MPAFLLKNPIASILGVALLVALIIAFLMYLHIGSLNSTIDTQKTEIANLTAANDLMKASIDTQNKAIDDLKAQEQEREKRAAAEIAKATTQAEKHKARAYSFLQRSVTGDECQAANSLLDEYRRAGSL